MSSVDSRIVTMKFENTSFNRGVSSTISSLDKLKSSMNLNSATTGAKSALGGLMSAFGKFTGLKNPFSSVSSSLGGLQEKVSIFSRLNPFSRSTRGVEELQSAEGKFNTNTITGAVTGISKSFLAMSTVAITALSNITTQAIQTGAQLVKSLTVDPIMSGFHEYETQLNSIQTILANTGLKGDKGLAKVNTALSQLNHYSDKTIYNFTEMAKNIGTFTAAGVDLDTSVSSIKGIANLAAISGSSSAQASTAMYQLSQALASGKVSLMDWNSVVNAGMGGKVFQTALTRTAQTMGTLNKNAIKTTGPMNMLSIKGKSFRESISAESGDSWLTSDVLTKTLSQLSGDMSDAELKAQGFTEGQIKAIQEMAKTGVNAATKVKTLTQLMDTMKEAVGSGWAKSFAIIFGNFTEAKELWTNVSNTLGGLIQSSANARNKLLKDWDALGGRKAIITGIGNAFHALMAFIKPIGEAFRDIFPAKTAEDLYNMSTGFRDFTKGLMISGETAENLKRTFRGVFSIFSIVGQVIGGLVGMIGRLAGSLSDGSGGFLDFTGGIGDFLYSVDQALKKGHGLENFFTGLGDILAIPLKLLRTVAGWIGKLFSGFQVGSAEVVTGAVDHVKTSLSPVAKLGETIGDVFSKVGGWLATAAKAIGRALGGIGDAIAGAFGPDTFDKSLDLINTALIGGIVLLIKNFMDKGLSIDLTGGIGDSIKKTLGSVTGALESMQTQIKADVLMKIAISLGILAASIVLLASIDPKKMAFALGGLTAGFVGLQGALIVLSKAISYMGTLKLPFIILGLLGLAGAMFTLSVALKIMSSIEFGDMLRGLAGLAGSLFIMMKAMTSLSKSAGGMIRAGAAMLILSVAMNAIAVAMKIFASMDLKEIGKGLLAMAGSLAIIVGAMHLMPKGMLAQAAALTAIGVAVNLIATSLRIFGGMSLVEIGKSLVALGGSLVIIAGALYLMEGALPGAAALLVAAGALMVLAPALRIMSGMGWEEIAKGMVALAGSLLILAGGLYLMEAALPGAAALIVAAGALAILAPVLVALGAMSWKGIAKGLVALAGTFIILGVAGAVMAPVIPVILGLGAAMLLLGAGMALAGAGALAFGTAFAEVVAVGGHGVRILGKMIGVFVKSIPDLMKAFAHGILEFVKTIAKAGPQFVKAWSKILSNFLDAIIKNAPKMATAFIKMLDAALKVITKTGPKISRAGLTLIIGFLKAVSDKLPRLIDLGAKIVIQLMNGITRNDQKLINAGVRMIIDFTNDLANAIDAHSTALGQAGGRLAVAIVRGMANGIQGGIDIVGDAVRDLAGSAINSAKNFLGISSPSKEFAKIGMYSTYGLAKGIGHHKAVKELEDSIVRVSRQALRRARKILRQTDHKKLANDLLPRNRPGRHHNDPVGDSIKNAHHNRHKHTRNLEKEYVRVSKDALERARKILRHEHHKHLAELLKPKKPPKIRPVLDLGAVKKDSKKMHDIIHKGPQINPHISSGRARTISADKRQANADVNRVQPVAETPAPVQFTQNNYSPKALSPVDVYRNTNSQLSLAKEALKKT